MKKDSKQGSVRRPKHRKGAHSVYSNITTKKRTNADSKSRKKAEYLSTLPKSRIKRLTYRMHPKRFFAYWFSKEGMTMALKLAGIGIAVFIVMILGIFAVFRKDLAIGPDELTKRVQSRTTKFYDRTNQVLLYELYKDQQLTFVQPDQINNNMKYATVAIEDKDFYKHGGFDTRGIIRSVVNNASGGGKQGASTITQQLARNVILEDNTRSGIAGYTRKVKEIILSIELERTYSKDQILNYYLNSIGYGGTAYGVESASKRYFDKSAKDLSIEEAAYIASIPQYPSLYDSNSPNFDKEATLARQETVIDYMREQGYITPQQAKDAKAVDVFAKIKPLTNDPTTKLAPHFVDEVITQLEGKYGADNVRKGGWRITTTIDWDMQQLAEKSVAENMAGVESRRGGLGGNNAALVAVAPATGQVLSMAGSRGYTYPEFGSYNAATSDLQPGSSLKPFVYGTLFQGNTYGAGSVIPDSREAFYGIYPNNFDKKFRGNISIRMSLAESRNLPAMKAANIAGMQNVINNTKVAGETDISCGQSNECSDPFLAIGSGTVRLDQHTTAYAALANKGIAKPETYVLKIEKPDGEIVEEWKDSAGTPVFNDPARSEEISYILSEILSDDPARAVTFGRGLSYFNPKGVKIAVKTGTTDNSKDGWMMGYSPKIAVGVWAGRSDGQAMGGYTDSRTGPIFGAFMKDVHASILSKPQYGYKSNEWYTKPGGIQKLSVSGRSDIFPSWYKKPKEELKDYVMDRVSKKLATACTPEAAKETIKIVVVSDPTKPGSQTPGAAPDGYDISKEDDVHICGDPLPTASIDTVPVSGKTYTLKSYVTTGKYTLQTVEFIVNGQV
ncbi:transglycosylase domain-containing protein, partial [Candidatus Saccharibacteria bacterium]|nr:transglycosylase domain-containing protein [Candidatus Saccharibacteria bacterium]